MFAKIQIGPLVGSIHRPQNMKYLDEIRAAESCPGSGWECIHEIDGMGDDCNKGYGGSFMYLWMHETPSSNNAATDIVFLRSKDGQNLGQDIAKGTGGDFRYIITKKEAGKQKIDMSSVKLWRTGDKGSKPSKRDYHHWCSDINAGRGKDFLYVCWNVGKDEEHVKVVKVECILDPIYQIESGVGYVKTTKIKMKVGTKENSYSESKLTKFATEVRAKCNWGPGGAGGNATVSGSVESSFSSASLECSREYQYEETVTIDARNHGVFLYRGVLVLTLSDGSIVQMQGKSLVGFKSNPAANTRWVFA